MKYDLYKKQWKLNNNYLAKLKKTPSVLASSLLLIHNKIEPSTDINNSL